MIITLLSDFGVSDPYVGEMKGRILQIAPAATLVDLTHAIPAGDIPAGAFLLSRGWTSFGPHTVHLAVVDPGVGTARSGLAVAAADHWFVGPDNGLLSIAVAAPDSIWRLDAARVVPDGAVSATFHGRDIFAPAAARLAAGEPVEAFADPVQTMSGLEPVVEMAAGALVGEVLWVDHFGNAITAIRADQIDAMGAELEVRAGALRLTELHSTFGDVESLSPLAYVGGAGTLELAVRDGDLSERFGIHRGTRVEVRGSAPA